MENSRNSQLSEIFDDAVNAESQSPLWQELQNCEERFTSISHYRSGGSKMIYEAYDRLTDRHVAVAMLADDAPQNKIDSFLREARLNALLQHPNIIPVYDIGIREEKPYFCMKFIAGDSLADILKRLREGDKKTHKRFPLSGLLDIFDKICDAVAYAHSHGVLHLDLKPDNIRIDRFGDVLLCDWGLAKVIDERDEIEEHFCALEKYSLSADDIHNPTVDGFSKGTPGYMAPEQTGLFCSEKNIQTDVYSLGAVLYSLLTYEKAFSGDLEEILFRTVKGNFPRPSQRRNSVPEALEAVCLKAMSLEPSQRYNCVEDLQQDISAYRRGYATSAEAISFVKISRLLICRNKLLSTVIGLAILSLLLLSLIFVGRLEQSRDQAIDLAGQYRIEKEEKEKLSRTLAAQFIKKYRQAHADYRFNDALAYINSAVELDPSNKDSWFCKAQLHSIAFDFDESLSAYSKAGRLDSLGEIARKFKLWKQPLSADQKLQVLSEAVSIHGNDRPAGEFVHHQVYSQMGLAQRVDFVRGVLILFNPQMKGMNFDLDVELSHLDVSDNPQLKWGFALQNFPAESIDISNTGLNHFKNIRAVPVQKLNASHTGIRDFAHLTLQKLRVLNIAYTNIRSLNALKKSPIQILDIRHASIESLSPLKSMQFLRVLRIHRGQFPQTQLDALPKRIDVEISD